MVDYGREEMEVYTTAAFAALLLQLVAEPAIPPLSDQYAALEPKKTEPLLYIQDHFEGTVIQIVISCHYDYFLIMYHALYQELQCHLSRHVQV